MPATATRQQAVTRELSRDPRQVRRARHLARQALARWDLAGQTDVTELIVSELVTNAIRHGAGPIRLTLSRTAAALRIEVRDRGAGRPQSQHATPADEGGRGLDLIDALTALHHGTLAVLPNPGGPGKTMRVSLPVPLQL